MVRWLRWHCPPDTGFEIRALAVWGRARYLSVTEAPHNIDFHTWMGKKHFCSFQTAETGNRTPNSWKAAALTTTLGPPPSTIVEWIGLNELLNEILALAVRGRARYLSLTDVLRNIKSLGVSGEETFDHCIRAPVLGVEIPFPRHVWCFNDCWMNWQSRLFVMREHAERAADRTINVISTN